MQAAIESFIAVRLGLTIVLLGALPAALALQHSPFALWQGGGFLALFIPPLSVVALCRSATLSQAQTISLAGPLIAGLIVALFDPSHSRFTFNCLFLAMIEAFLARKYRFALTIALCAPIVLPMTRFLSLEDLSYSPASITGSICDIILISYAAALGWANTRMSAANETRERRRASRYEALARTIGDLVLRKDRTGLVLTASQEALSMFDLSPTAILGRGFFERVHIADRPAYLKAVSEAYASCDTVTVTIRFQRGKRANDLETCSYPEFAWIELRMRSIVAIVDGERTTDSASDSASVVALVRDVTRAKIAETDLMKAHDNLARATIWKDRFLANVSHELRTPLNAIIGFAEMLASKQLSPAEPERRMEYAQIIHSSGLHLLEMVNSILDMSKIDAGSFDILPEPFDLPRLLDQCCDMIGLKAEQGDIKLERDYPSDLEELVADKRACKQILLNLLSNAVKFTYRGGTVKVSARPEGAMFAISVSDDGIGISSSDLKQIGQPFFQASNASTRAYEGTGLGLSLVRGLVGLHGGRIAIESAVGHGTTVTIHLPAYCTAPASQQDPIEIDAIVRIGAMSARIPSNAFNSVKKIA